MAGLTIASASAGAGAGEGRKAAVERCGTVATGHPPRLRSALLAAMGLLLATPSSAIDEKLAQDTFFPLCCATKSYDGRGPRGLVLGDPTVLFLKTFVKQMPSDSDAQIKGFIGRLSELTGVHLLNPAGKLGEAVKSELWLLALPAKRDDLSDRDIDELDGFFSKMKISKESAHPTNPDLQMTRLSDLLGALYRSDRQYSIFHDRVFKADGSVAVAIIIFKPIADTDVVALTERAMLEGFGYDADNDDIESTFFAQGSSGHLTDIDEITLSALYHRGAP